MKKRSNKQTGWLKSTAADIVDIMPRGEESRHIADPACECGPRLSRDTEGRQMIIHNSWDGREGFEAVGGRQSAVGSQRRAA